MLHLALRSSRHTRASHCPQHLLGLTGKGGSARMRPWPRPNRASFNRVRDRGSPASPPSSPATTTRNTIPGLVEAVEAALKQITDDYEIIVVNDASTRQQRRSARRRCRRSPCPARRPARDQPRLRRRPRAAASSPRRKDYVFYTDGDGQYDPAELVLLAQHMQPGVDVVNGYKISRQDPWYRQVIGSLYQHTAHVALQPPHPRRRLRLPPAAQAPSST